MNLPREPGPLTPSLSPAEGERVYARTGEGVRFTESFNLQDWTRIEAMNLPSEFVLVPRPRARSFGARTESRTKDEDEDGSTWLKNGS
jgi:hypothetical protein